MYVYIKEWSNKSASLLTANGQVVWTFSSYAEARRACIEWRSIVHSSRPCTSDPDDQDMLASCYLA